MNTKRKRLYLVGAGDVGRMMESWLDLIPGFHSEWEIMGFLDKNPDALRDYPTMHRILGDPVNFNFSPDDYVLMSLSNPDAKQYLAGILRDKVRFFNFIAPNSILGKYLNLGTGVIICPNTCFVSNTNIGDFTFINTGTNIGHDCTIGAYSSIMSNVDLGGRVKLGERVYIGTNAAVIPDTTVGNDIKIGVGSIVIRDLKKPGTYFGNPARLLKF